MPSLKSNSKRATTAKWKSVGGEQVLMVATDATGKTGIKELTAGLTKIITQRLEFGDEEMLIRLGFNARKERAKAERKRAPDPAETAREKQPFDPEAKGMQLVEKAKTAEGGAWSGSELQRRFLLSSSNLHRRRKEHRIISWRDAHHSFFYPKWQFTETGALRRGIREVLDIFKSSDEWRIMRYFLAPRYQLEGKRPLDLLRAGEVEMVLSHARTHAEEGSW